MVIDGDLLLNLEEMFQFSTGVQYFLKIRIILILKMYVTYTFMLKIAFNQLLIKRLFINDFMTLNLLTHTMKGYKNQLILDNKLKKATTIKLKICSVTVGRNYLCILSVNKFK